MDLKGFLSDLRLSDVVSSCEANNVSLETLQKLALDGTFFNEFVRLIPDLANRIKIIEKCRELDELSTDGQTSEAPSSVRSESRSIFEEASVVFVTKDSYPQSCLNSTVYNVNDYGQQVLSIAVPPFDNQILQTSNESHILTLNQSSKQNSTLNSSVDTLNASTLNQSDIESSFFEKANGRDKHRQTTQITFANLEPSEENKFNLKDLLESTIFGRALLLHTALPLDSKCQGYLSNIIVSHFLNQKPNPITLKNENFQKLAQHIISLFPKEVPQVYYMPPLRKRDFKENKSGISRGKLVDSYRNKLTFLRKCGLLPTSTSRKRKSGDQTESEEEDTDKENSDVIWLKHNSVPWEEVIYKWEATFDMRDNLIKQDVPLDAILERFPILKISSGHVLVAEDFRRKFPSKFGKLYTNFETVFTQLLDLRKKCLGESDNLLVDLLDSEDLRENSRHYLMLNLLSSLLPSVKTGNKSKRKQWQPTDQDVKHGLVILLKTPGEVPLYCQKRKEKFRKLGLPLLPVVVIEGPKYTEFNKILVSFDDIIYNADTVLKAVDICFMLIHVLNLNYPFECAHVYLFIQLAMYELKTKYDNIPNIADIVNKINIVLKK